MSWLLLPHGQSTAQGQLSHAAEEPTTDLSTATIGRDEAWISIRLSGGRLGFLLIHGLGGPPLEMRDVACQGEAASAHCIRTRTTEQAYGTALPAASLGRPPEIVVLNNRENQARAAKAPGVYKAATASIEAA